MPAAALSDFPFQARVLPRFSPPATTPSHRLNRTRFEQAAILDAPPPRITSGSAQPWYLSRARRTIDRFGAAALRALSAPVLLVAAIAIKLETSGPIFFRQWRMGFGGERFLLLRRRTTRKDAEGLKESLRQLSHYGPTSPDFKIRNHPQVTSVGRILRRLSLDELPERTQNIVHELEPPDLRNQRLEAR